MDFWKKKIFPLKILKNVAIQNAECIERFKHLKWNDSDYQVQQVEDNKYYTWTVTSKSCSNEISEKSVHQLSFHWNWFEISIC